MEVRFAKYRSGGLSYGCEEKVPLVSLAFGISKKSHSWPGWRGAFRESTHAHIWIGSSDNKDYSTGNGGATIVIQFTGSGTPKLAGSVIFADKLLFLVWV